MHIWTHLIDAQWQTYGYRLCVLTVLLHSVWHLSFFSKICSLLHQRYKDFSPSLTQGLLKVFFPGKSGDDLDADKNLKAMKKRSTLKLLLELYFVGVIEDSGIFMNIIKDLTNLEHLKDRDTTQTNMTLLASFARQGRIFLGLTFSGQEIHEEVQFLFGPLNDLVHLISLVIPVLFMAFHHLNQKWSCL